MPRYIFSSLAEVAEEFERRADADDVFAEKCASARDRRDAEIRALVRREDAALLKSAEIQK